MKRFSLISVFTAIIVTGQPVFAGEFYKLYPRWLDQGYHVVLAALLLVGFFVCLSIFNNFKGGKLGLPWIIIMIGFIAGLARSILSVLTVFDMQYFQAAAFAGLDILFFVLLLLGLILYKFGLE